MFGFSVLLSRISAYTEGFFNILKRSDYYNKLRVVL